MNIGRHINKHHMIKEHRKSEYLLTLDRLFNGQAKVSQVSYRYRKLKQVL